MQPGFVCEWEAKAAGAHAPQGTPNPPGASTKAFAAGSVWKGKRSYRQGAYSPSSVVYELHVRERDGAKFKGYVFDKGSGRNRAEVEGDIDGETIRWRESMPGQGRITVVDATLREGTIELRFTGKWENGATTKGDGELKLVTDGSS